MAITRVQSKDSHLISSVADVLAAAKKVVVITGAGISTNCGIPVSLMRKVMEPVTDAQSRTSDLKTVSTSLLVPSATRKLVRTHH
jgi:hypothetical protein